MGCCDGSSDGRLRGWASRTGCRDDDAVGMTTLSAGRTGFGWAVRRAVDTASATAERSAGWTALPKAVRTAAGTGGTKWERPSAGRTELPRAAGLAVDLVSALVAKKKFPSADWRDPAKSGEWTSAKSNKIYCESSILLVPNPMISVYFRLAKCHFSPRFQIQFPELKCLLQRQVVKRRVIIPIRIIIGIKLAPRFATRSRKTKACIRQLR